MNNTVIVKNIEIGLGIPKVCVSLIGKTEEQIYAQAKKIKVENVDIAEWRIDYLDLKNCNDEKKRLIEIIKKIGEILENIPIIATFRTKGEGGEKEIIKEEYIDLTESLIKNSNADMIDMELYTMGASVKEYVIEAHKYNKKIILSSHDFYGTPKQEDIVKCLCHMQKLGADIPKVAVMPKNSKDVLALLGATEEMKEKYNSTPIITMAMGKLGAISRLSGEVFGSAVTFGCMEQSSAPGQINVKTLRDVLNLIHEEKL